MKKTTILSVAFAFLTTTLTGVQANYGQQPMYQGQASYVMAGTPINTSLDTTLGTEFSNVGDKFTATLSSPVYAGSQLIAPPGSKAEGFVTEVTPAGRGGKPGSMDLRITNIITPNGQRVPISASINKSTFKLQADGGRVSNYAKATSAGAAGGALSGLIGGAISGGKFGKSTAIGTGIGAGVGILGGTFKKGRELIINQGMAIPFVVEASTQPVQSPMPTQVQQYGSDFHPGGYHAPQQQQQYRQAPVQQPIYQQQQHSQNYQPVQTQQQAPQGGFADPYSAPTSAPAPQTAAPSGYQTQQPYNPYLD